MAFFKQLRQNSPLFRSLFQHYHAAKRKVRILKLPSALYNDYKNQLAQSQCYHLSSQLEDIPSFIGRPVNKYLNRYWPGKEKLIAAITTVKTIESRLNDEAISQLFSTARTGLKIADIELKSGDHAQLKLIYSQYPREGDLSVHLLNEHRQKIYVINFSFGKNDELYIGSLQGSSHENSAELVKSITKQTHGLRPKNLLVSSIYGIARHFGYQTVLGISNNAQIKSQHLKSSYNHFWEECGATAISNGWYQLPSEEPARDIETVKSQHRSAFRKREALREAMVQSIITSLRHHERRPDI